MTTTDTPKPVHRYVKEMKGHIPGRTIIEGWVDEVMCYSEAVEAGHEEEARNRARAAIRPRMP